MWKLEKQEGKRRTYSNSLTDSKCSITEVYEDSDGNKWYYFDDLASIPHLRKFAAMKISSLYTLGLSKEDLTHHISSTKTLLKSNDSEKYEKIFANILDFESKVTNATDVLKQISSLTCVYFTLNDEPIDSFDNSLQLKKMQLLEADPSMHSFFLSKQIEVSEHYHNTLKIISQTASPSTNGK